MTGSTLALWIGLVVTMALGCRQSYLLGKLRGRRDAERDLAETVLTALPPLKSGPTFGVVDLTLPQPDEPTIDLVVDERTGRR